MVIKSRRRGSKSRSGKVLFRRVCGIMLIVVSVRVLPSVSQIPGPIVAAIVAVFVELLLLR